MLVWKVTIKIQDDGTYSTCLPAKSEAAAIAKVEALNPQMQGKGVWSAKKLLV